MIQTDSKTLISGEPIIPINRNLAEKIGINEAIILQQIHFLCLSFNNLRDGGLWTYQSVKDLKNNHFKWLSERTLHRTLANLKRSGLLIATNKFSPHAHDKRLWYTLDYEKIRRIMLSKLP
jgi:hypothetical protein